MRITIVAVGRAKAGPAGDLYDFYAGRLSDRLPGRPLGALRLKEVEERRSLPPAALREREGGLLLAAVPAGAFLVGLDAGGRAMDSEAFAKWLADLRDAGRQELAFAIGGAEGLSGEVKARADRLLSLGAMTWPHLLVRGMLAEQLYRAQSILGGHPYHRG